MTLIKSFEEMLSWQKARELNKIIYKESGDNKFAKDFALKDQIRKSSISVMSNIAEGYERNSKPQFKYFMQVAKGSAGELRSQLYVAYDLEYLSKKDFDTCLNHVKEISSLINGFIIYLDKSLSKTKTKK